MKTSFALPLIASLCFVSVFGQEDGGWPNYQLSGTFLLEPSQTIALPMYALPQNISDLYQQPIAFDPSIFQQSAYFMPQPYSPQGYVPISQSPVAQPQAWPYLTNARPIAPTTNVNYPQPVQVGVPGFAGQQMYYFQPAAAPAAVPVATPVANKAYPTVAPKALPPTPCQLLMQKMMAQNQAALPLVGQQG